MYQILFMFLALNSLTVSAQSVSVDTLFVPTVETVSDFPSAVLKFPIIRTGSTLTDSLINRDLVDNFTHHEFPDLSPDSAIIKWTGGQIAFLDFEVTYNKNNLISLNISAEGCGAYCTRWTEYFTYSTSLGKRLSIDQVIDTLGYFKKCVLRDAKRQSDSNRIELKSYSQDKNGDIDEETYNWLLEYYDYCDNSFNLKTFALHPEHIEIIKHCYIPNVVKNLTPTFNLKYKYSDFSKQLKIKN
ncbi:MAG: hypothetical protein EOP48_06640 [Sphingobacteriales bacterium]|nr:MAG: hypothetical protein EOP48_06640 [Sphingobacteriales bacterium]